MLSQTPAAAFGFATLSHVVLRYVCLISVVSVIVVRPPDPSGNQRFTATSVLLSASKGAKERRGSSVPGGMLFASASTAAVQLCLFVSPRRDALGAAAALDTALLLLGRLRQNASSNSAPAWNLTVVAPWIGDCDDDMDSLIFSNRSTSSTNQAAWTRMMFLFEHAMVTLSTAQLGVAPPTASKRIPSVSSDELFLSATSASMPMTVSRLEAAMSSSSMGVVWLNLSTPSHAAATLGPWPLPAGNETSKLELREWFESHWLTSLAATWCDVALGTGLLTLPEPTVRHRNRPTDRRSEVRAVPALSDVPFFARSTSSAGSSSLLSSRPTILFDHQSTSIASAGAMAAPRDSSNNTAATTTISSPSGPTTAIVATTALPSFTAALALVAMLEAWQWQRVVIVSLSDLPSDSGASRSPGDLVADFVNQFSTILETSVLSPQGSSPAPPLALCIAPLSWSAKPSSLTGGLSTASAQCPVDPTLSFYLTSYVEAVAREEISNDYTDNSRHRYVPAARSLDLSLRALTGYGIGDLTAPNRWDPATAPRNSTHTANAGGGIGARSTTYWASAKRPEIVADTVVVILTPAVYRRLRAETAEASDKAAAGWDVAEAALRRTVKDAGVAVLLVNLGSEESWGAPCVEHPWLQTIAGLLCLDVPAWIADNYASPTTYSSISTSFSPSSSTSSADALASSIDSALALLDKAVPIGAGSYGALARHSMITQSLTDTSATVASDTVGSTALAAACPSITSVVTAARVSTSAARRAELVASLLSDSVGAAAPSSLPLIGSSARSSWRRGLVSQLGRVVSVVDVAGDESAARSASAALSGGTADGLTTSSSSSSSCSTIPSSLLFVGEPFARGNITFALFAGAKSAAKGSPKTPQPIARGRVDNTTRREFFARRSSRDESSAAAAPLNVALDWIMQPFLLPSGDSSAAGNSFVLPTQVAPRYFVSRIGADLMQQFFATYAAAASDDAIALPFRGPLYLGLGWAVTAIVVVALAFVGGVAVVSVKFAPRAAATLRAVILRNSTNHNRGGLMAGSTTPGEKSTISGGAPARTGQKHRDGDYCANNAAGGGGGNNNNTDWDTSTAEGVAYGGITRIVESMPVFVVVGGFDVEVAVAFSPTQRFNVNSNFVASPTVLSRRQGSDAREGKKRLETFREYVLFTSRSYSGLAMHMIDDRGFLVGFRAVMDCIRFITDVYTYIHQQAYMPPTVLVASGNVATGPANVLSASNLLTAADAHRHRSLPSPDAPGGGPGSGDEVMPFTPPLSASTSPMVTNCVPPHQAVGGVTSGRRHVSLESSMNEIGGLTTISPPPGAAAAGPSGMPLAQSTRLKFSAGIHIGNVDISSVADGPIYAERIGGETAHLAVRLQAAACDGRALITQDVLTYLQYNEKAADIFYNSFQSVHAGAMHRDPPSNPHDLGVVSSDSDSSLLRGTTSGNNSANTSSSKGWGNAAGSNNAGASAGKGMNCTVNQLTLRCMLTDPPAATTANNTSGAAVPNNSLAVSPTTGMNPGGLVVDGSAMSPTTGLRTAAATASATAIQFPRPDPVQPLLELALLHYGNDAADRQLGDFSSALPHGGAGGGAAGRGGTMSVATILGPNGVPISGVAGTGANNNVAWFSDDSAVSFPNANVATHLVGDVLRKFIERLPDSTQRGLFMQATKVFALDDILATPSGSIVEYGPSFCVVGVDQEAAASDVPSPVNADTARRVSSQPTPQPSVAANPHSWVIASRLTLALAKALVRFLPVNRSDRVGGGGGIATARSNASRGVKGASNEPEFGDQVFSQAGSAHYQQRGWRRSSAQTSVLSV